jgi:hypothetical protein
MARVVVSLDGRKDVDVKRKACRRCVELRDDGTHDAVGLQAPHTLQRGCRRQADKPSQLDVRTVSVGLELFQQRQVN